MDGRTFLAFNKPDHKLFNGVSKLRIGLETLLKALVMVLELTLANVCHWRERVYGDVVVRVETRFIAAFLAPCTVCVCVCMRERESVC